MIEGKPRQYWDTSVWAAWNNNDHDNARETCNKLLREAEEGKLEIALSTLVVAEFCPPKTQEFDDLLNKYLQRSQFIFVAVNRVIAEMARALTGKYSRLKGADAVHVATAIFSKAEVLYTYDDKDMLKFAPVITEIKISKPVWTGQMDNMFKEEAPI